MLKQIIIFLFITLGLFLNNSISYADCKYEEGTGIAGILSNCKPDRVVGQGTDKYDVEGGLKDRVNSWTANIALVIGILAVGALVYAAFLMQFSMGEDEKIKKAKDIIKWTIIGFIGLISVYAVIYVVINLMFTLGG